MHSDWRNTTATPSTWPGRLTDGRSAASYPVEVTLDTAGLKLTWPGAAGPAVTWPYDSLTTPNPIRDTTDDVLLSTKTAPAATLFVPDRGFALQLARQSPHLAIKAARLQGLKPGAIAGAIAFSIAASVWAFDLSPSKAIARMMPETARAKLGQNVLSTLPIAKTCSEADGLAAVEALSKRLRPGVEAPARLVSVVEWQDPRVVNAFTLPGGQVILTRAIIEKAVNADEIAGVLAHEMGHGMELHPEAGLVRSVGFWALIQMVFTGTPGAIGNAGSALAQLAYTRSYEREADAIALKLLRDAKISHRPFAGFFRKMDSTKPSQPSRPRFGSDIFDTHPSTPERIQTIEKQADYPSTPALTDAQWQALRRICGTAGALPQSAGKPTGVQTQGTDIKPAANNSAERIAQASARIAANPRDAAAHHARGELYMTEGRTADALTDFTKATELDPQSAFYRYNRARALHNEQKYDAAIADYTEALRLNPNYAMALAGRGTVRRVQKNPAEAMKDFDAAIAINPRLTFAYYQRGLLNASLSKWAESEGDFSRAIGFDRTYAFAYFRRGEAYEKLNQRDKAIADYRDALKASPSSPNAADAFKLARERLTALGVPERP